MKRFAILGAILVFLVSPFVGAAEQQGQHDTYLQQIFKEVKGKQEFRLQILDVASRGEALLPALTRVLHDSKAEWQERWFSAMALAHIGGKQAQSELRKALKDILFIVRLAAIKGLARMGDPAIAPDLHRMVSDSAMVVRSEVVHTLALFNDQRAVAPLAVELHQEKNFYRGRSLPVRGNIIQALGKLGSAEAVPSLMRELEREDKELHGQTMVVLASIAPSGKYANPPPGQGKARQDWIDWWTKERALVKVTQDSAHDGQAAAKGEGDKTTPIKDKKDEKNQSDQQVAREKASESK